MRPGPGKSRSGALIGLLVATGALALSACGTPTTSVQSVTGTPSINVSVGLSSVGCTGSDSCVAVGTSQTGGPTTAGEVRLARGRWIAIGDPRVTSAFVTNTSCGQSQCLLVGLEPTGDLVWRYDGATRTLSALVAPVNGNGVDAVGCDAQMTCMIADTTIAGPRVMMTTDAGATWSTVSPPTSAPGDRVDHLACTSALDCLAVTQLATGGVDFSVTSDGATSWTNATTSTPADVTSVSSLSCVARQCTVVYDTDSGPKVARSTDFAARWSDLRSVGPSPRLVACASSSRCVIAGQSGRATPWIETTVGRHVVRVDLKYVPSPIEALSCGTRLCAGVGVATVLTVRP